MKKIKTLIISILVLMAATVGIYLFLQGNSGFKFNDSATIIKEVKQLGRLETVSFTLEKIIDGGTQGNVFEEFLFGDKILLIANGEVIAGVDFTKLDSKKIKVEQQKVYLELPAPEIFSVILNQEQTRVYDRSTGLLTKGNKNLESEAREEAAQKIEQAACEAKILDKANQNAQEQVQVLLKALGFKQVVIQTSVADC